jgi:hypothetical protein
MLILSKCEARSNANFKEFSYFVSTFPAWNHSVVFGQTNAGPVHIITVCPTRVKETFDHLIVRERTQQKNGQIQRKKLHKFYSQVIKSKRMRRTGHVARLGMTRNTYKFSAGKFAGKSLFRRTRYTVFSLVLVHGTVNFSYYIASTCWMTVE